MDHTVHIIVKEKHDGIHAFIEGKSEINAQGETQEEAIGKLVNEHPERFHIRIRKV